MKESNEWDLGFEFTENQIIAILTNKEGHEIRKSAPCNLQSPHYPSEILPELPNEQLREQFQNHFEPVQPIEGVTS